MIDSEFQNLTSAEVLKLIWKYEEETDRLLAGGKMTQWRAWEAYFGLIYVCNLWNFDEDRERIVAKIDQKQFNPFESNNPNILIIALDIAHRQNIHTTFDN